MISDSLRALFFSRVRKKLRATCIVIVDAPCARVPPRTSASSARNAFEIDAAVLIKTAVFDRQQRLLHDLGDVADRYEIAMLGTEFTDQYLVGGIHSKRDLGPVVGDRIERWQVRRDDQQRVTDQQRCAGAQRQNRNNQPTNHGRAMILRSLLLKGDKLLKALHSARRVYGKFRALNMVVISS